MPVFGERAEKIRKPATEITSIKVSRARCDKEITLPMRVRIDLDKGQGNLSSLWSSADSLSSSSEPVIFRILMGVFKGYSIPDR